MYIFQNCHSPNQCMVMQSMFLIASLLHVHLVVNDLRSTLNAIFKNNNEKKSNFILPPVLQPACVPPLALHTFAPLQSKCCCSDILWIKNTRPTACCTLMCLLKAFDLGPDGKSNNNNKIANKPELCLPGRMNCLKS